MACLAVGIYEKKKKLKLQKCKKEIKIQGVRIKIEC